MSSNLQGLPRQAAGCGEGPSPAERPARPAPEAGVRMRVVFSSGDEVKFIGHLDLVRAWVRAIRRSGLPLAYSQGFNPQARIQFAAALPLGFTGCREILDIFLTGGVSPDEVMSRLEAALPAGIRLQSAEPVPGGWPALQSLVSEASYYVEVETEESAAEFVARLEAFLARRDAHRERRRGKQMSRYDLRPLVLELRPGGRGCSLGQAFDVRMRNAPGATGRPDELLAELGYGDRLRRITRTAIHFKQVSDLHQRANALGEAMECRACSAD